MKTRVTDFALFGGPREFAETVLVGRPNTGDPASLYARLDAVLETGHLTSFGPMVREFEARIADLAGTAHCVATCNGTAALEVMIRTAGLTGEVIIPSMTYVATAHAVRSLGLTPVFCDLDPLTGCIDPDRVEELITPDTSGLIGVHLWGQPCDVERLEKIAEAHDLTLFFDAAHGVACSLGDTPIGGFGTAEMFSFHATKVLNTFEGGAIVTNDDRFADRARRVHNFGWGEGRMTDFVGVNAKMNEASGAMGLTSLEALPSSIAANHANYVLYSAELSGLPGVTVHQYDDRNRNNYQYVVVKVDEQVCGLPRDAVLALLHADNVLAQRYFWPCAHELEPYRTETPTALPATEHLAAQVIALPTGPRTSRDTIGRICGLIRLAARNAPEVSARWRLTNPT